MNTLATQPIKSKDKVLYPKLVDSLNNILRIVCGSDHCFAIKANSEIYAWGNNSKYQLGIPQEGSLTNVDAPRIIYQPTIVEALLNKGVDRIATGTDHSFAWRNGRGEVFGWGSGNFGKLGHGNRSNYSTPTMLECFKDASSVGMKVSEIICGDNHTLAVLENAEEGHELFVWGSSKSWQLGLDGELSDDVLDPHSIDPDPFDGKVLTIGGCHNYSSCVTKDGKIYTWGSGEFGRLGYATETRQQKIPKLINGLEKIVKISLGFYHSAAINQQGIVYSWGRGINGQLGHGDSPNEDYPKPIKSLSNRKVVDITCGENHTVAITDLGEIFSWGAGQFGQLGHGDILRQCSPTKIGALEEKIIIQVSAGRKHTAALTANGLVYTWGSNEFGQLGLKSLGNLHMKKPSQIFPDKLYPAYSARTYTQGSPIDYLQEKNEEKPDLISDSNDNLTFSPIGQFPYKLSLDIKINPSSEKKGNETQDLVAENKNLIKRIKELELRNDPNEQKNAEKNCHDLTNQYVKTLEEECTCKSGDVSKKAIVKNTKIDEIFKEFRVKISEIENADSVTQSFCLSMFEKICELKKKANYSMI